MLPDLRDFDRLRAEFRWDIPARYNIGVDVCDRWAAADPDRPAILDVSAPTARVDTLTFGALRDALEPPRQRCCARRGVRPGDRVGDPAAAGRARSRSRMCADLQARRDRAAARRRCSAPTRSPTGWRMRAPRRWSPTRPGVAKRRGASGPSCRELEPMLSIDGPDGRRARLPRGDRARTRRISRPLDTDAGRSGADDLHVRHHRPAQGRAARPPRAARPSARLRAAARLLPAAGRPALDAGRLGLGGRPPQRAAAEPAFRRAGRGAEVRQVRSRGGLRADGGSRRSATPSSRRRRCACCAPSSARAAASSFALRTVVLGRRGARGRDRRLGPRGARAHRSTRPTARPSATSCSAPASALGVVQAGRDRQAGARATTSAIIRPDGSRCEPGELGQIAVRRPDPVMFLGYWNNAGGDARRSSSATG